MWAYLSLSVDILRRIFLRVDSGPEEGGLPAVHVILSLAWQIQSLEQIICCNNLTISVFMFRSHGKLNLQVIMGSIPVLTI